MVHNCSEAQSSITQHRDYAARSNQFFVFCFGRPEEGELELDPSCVVLCLFLLSHGWLNILSCLSPLLIPLSLFTFLPSSFPINPPLFLFCLSVFFYLHCQSAMNTLPPLPVNHIQIADDAVNRVPSNGTGTYTQQQRLEKPSLTRRSTEEVEPEQEKDERDVRKKQVRSHSPTNDNSD